jgi:integrase
MDRTDEFEKIRQLRGLISNIAREISPATYRDYLKKYSRMVRLKKSPEDMGKTSSGYYAYRAAFLHGTALEAREALKARDKALYQSPQWQAAMETINVCLRRFERYPPDPARTNHETGGNGVTWQGVKNQLQATNCPIERHSKKYTLAKIRKYPTWQEKLFSEIPKQYQVASAVSAMTGCRPSELEKGVRILLLDGMLVFAIAGSKISQHSGQSKRVLSIDPATSTEGGFLSQLLSQCNGGMVASIRSGKAFTEAVASAGRRAFPHLRCRLSPYVWRHSFASELKAANVPPDEIAMALGHRVTETQECYGRSAHGGGRSPIAEVHASEPVRITHRDPVAELHSSIPASGPRMY